MSTLTALLSVVPVLADKGPDPEDVKAGWLGFMVFGALAVGVVFLYFSLKKQLGRVRFDEDGDAGDGAAPDVTADGTADAAQEPRNGTPPSAPHRPQA